MKAIILLIASCSAISIGSTPEGVDKKEWAAYRSRKGEHDCAIKEDSNWFGAQRCFDSWECQGARMCERGLTKIGWCSGDSACPNMGPLDYHDEVSQIDYDSYDFVNIERRRQVESRQDWYLR